MNPHQHTLRSRTELDRPSDLAVFSHPNHELAVFGLMQRWRPAVVFLTDGGGAERVNQTREGLDSIGLLEQATFLNHTESSFYEALLDKDVRFFAGVARQVAAAIEHWQPRRVLCDAVEYYNPVHDISLPVVLHALTLLKDARAEVEVFEIPLIHQVESTGGEAYAVQRPVAARSRSTLAFSLTGQEVSAKRTARDAVYTLLSAQLGPVICGLPDDELATETLLPAMSPASRVGGSVLRYEWRAELLRRQGQVERPITYAGHFLPIAESLAGEWTSKFSSSPSSASTSC